MLRRKALDGCGVPPSRDLASGGRRLEGHTRRNPVAYRCTSVRWDVGSLRGGRLPSAQEHGLKIRKRFRETGNAGRKGPLSPAVGACLRRNISPADRSGRPVKLHRW